MSDDPGVMGNLPRSRPGRRSSKRGGGAGSEAKPETEVTAASAPKAKSGKSAAGRAKKPATTKRTTAGKKTTAAGSAPGSARGRASASTRQRKAAPVPQPDSAPRQEEATQGSTDPVTGAVLLAGRVVEGGMKVASGIIKRLPRP